MSEETQQGEYTHEDFLNALDELDDLTRTKQVANHVDCSEKVAREWVFKLEDEGELVSKEIGDRRLLWIKRT